MRPEDEADDRRLAGAVGPQEPEHVALADLHVEAVDRAQAAELLGERVRGQDGGAAVAALLPGPRPLRFTQASALPRRRASRRIPRQRTELANASRSLMGTMPPATAWCRPAARRSHRRAASRSERLRAVHGGGAEDLRGLLQPAGAASAGRGRLRLRQDDGAEALAVEQHAGRTGRSPTLTQRCRRPRPMPAPSCMPVAAPSAFISGVPEAVSGPPSPNT